MKTGVEHRGSGGFRWHRIVAALVALFAVPAAADQVVCGAESYPRAWVGGYHAGVLEFRTDEGKVKQAAITEVTRIFVDSVRDMTDLNEAEQYLADGEPAKAVARYRRILNTSREFWDDIIMARLVMACEQSDRIDQAVLYLIQATRSAQSGPPAGAMLLPQRLPDKLDENARRAVDQLETAIRAARDQDASDVWSFLRYDILRAAGSPLADEAAQEVARGTLGDAVATERMYAIKLRAFEALIAGDGAPAYLEDLDRALAYCPDPVLPGYLLLKGKTLLRLAEGREDLIHASWPLMRIVVHMKEDPRAAEALYLTAEIMDRLGRADKAVRLLDECIRHKHATDEVRGAAEELRRRLEPATQASP